MPRTATTRALMLSCILLLAGSLAVPPALATGADGARSGTSARATPNATNVGDQIIAQDTVWTAEGGPYYVDGRVQVASGVTLTIAPGAEVWVNKPIEIVGGLTAVGTADAPVVLHLNASLFRGIGAYTDASRVVEIRHADITGPAPLIDLSSDVYLGLTLADSHVSGLGTTYFWYLTSLVVERNTFDRVGTLEVGSRTNVSFAYNRFRSGPTRTGYNGSAQLVSWAAYSQPMQVHNNVFESSTRPRTLEISIDGRMDASGNCFGTTDVAQVKQWVRDQEDDLALKSVVGVEPLLEVAPEGVPALTPLAVAAPSATRGNGSAAVSWTAPVEDGGSPVTSYTVTSVPGGVMQTVDGGQTSADVTGLANGTSYTFTVTAKNAAGSSPASPTSNAVVPAGRPGQIRAPKVVVRGSKAVVRWTAANSNGSPITRYRVDISKGRDRTLAASARKTVFNGLAPGRYRVRVTARSAIGTGPYSAWVKFRIR